MQRTTSDSSSKSSRLGLKKWASKLSPTRGDARELQLGEFSKNDSHRGDNLSPQRSVHELDAAFGPSRETSPTNLSHNICLKQLREQCRRLQSALGSSQSIDTIYDVYSRNRERSLEDCKQLMQKSGGEPSDFQGSLATVQSGSSRSSSTDDPCLAAINEYKICQERLLEALRTSLLSTYLKYEPSASTKKINDILFDKGLRNSQIHRMRSISMHQIKSESLDFWPKYKIRFRNFDRINLDIKEMENLTSSLHLPAQPNSDSLSRARDLDRDITIDPDGETVLDFPNSETGGPHIRFRVSSHLLRRASPYFGQMFAESPSRTTPLHNIVTNLPPPATWQTLSDGSKVNVFRMPQSEPDKQEAFSILLHACHMHRQELPRALDIGRFVEVAQVCLKYQCTSTLEMVVEYEWLPQMLHRADESTRDGLLLIAWTFGIDDLFLKLSRGVVLSCTEEELREKTIWPDVVRNKIMTYQKAKLCEVYDYCSSAINDFLGPVRDIIEQESAQGSLVLTSVPRCPKGSHRCDAMNIGWLILVYHELRVLSSVTTTIDLRTPRLSRSLESLVSHLILMPSSPQLHSGVCDYAARFRNNILAIYNSISGLTLHNVSGDQTWGLSRRVGSGEHAHNGSDNIVHELPADLLAPSERLPASKTIFRNEYLTLQILSYLDNLQDLQSTSMISKAFYNAYRKREATLLKRIILLNTDKRRSRMELRDGVFNLVDSCLSRSDPRPDKSRE